MPKITNNNSPPISTADIINTFISTSRFTKAGSSETVSFREQESLLEAWINNLPYDWLQKEAWIAERDYHNQHHTEWVEAVQHGLEEGDNSKLTKFFNGRIAHVEEQVKRKLESEVGHYLTNEDLPCVDIGVFRLYRQSYYSNQGHAVNRELLGALEPGYKKALLLWVGGQGDNHFQFFMGLEVPSNTSQYDPEGLLRNKAYQRLAGKGISIDPSIFSNKQYVIENEGGPLHKFLQTWEQPAELIAVPSYAKGTKKTAVKPKGILVAEDTKGIENQGFERLLDCSRNIASELRYQSPFVYSQSHTR